MGTIAHRCSDLAWQGPGDDAALRMLGLAIGDAAGAAAFLGYSSVRFAGWWICAQRFSLQPPGLPVRVLLSLLNASGVTVLARGWVELPCRSGGRSGGPSGVGCD